MKKVLLLLICCCNALISQTIVQSYDTAGSYTFTVPAGVTYIKVECWGGGGGGGCSSYGHVQEKNGGGGGGGAYSRIDSMSVTSLTTHNIIVGRGGIGAPGYNFGWGPYPLLPAIAGGNSTFDSMEVIAAGGTIGLNWTQDTIYSYNGIGGAGGQSINCVGTVIHSGGNGASGTTSAGPRGGGGGGSGGVDSVGNNAGVPQANDGGTAVMDGGAGGAGAYTSSLHSQVGHPGFSPGGGGGGGQAATGPSGTDPLHAMGGGNGADGKVRITYTLPATVDVSEINNQQSQITLFPNPTTGQLTVHSEQLTITDIKVFNVLGECVLDCHPEPVEGQSTINISQFSNGIYLAEIKTEKGIVRKKIIKQ